MSSTNLIPRIHRAVVATGPGSLALRPVPVPPITDDQVLVRVAAIALNPSDYKLLDQSTTQGAVSGSDFAGTVVRVGAGVSHRVQVGDRICGLVFGANPGCPGNGAWGQYVAATLDLCMPIPPEMDFATAASLPMGTGTAGLAFRSLGLRWDRLAASSTVQETNANEYVLVHGGATATGTVLLQLLRMAGYAPLATCSPANFDLVIGRGAIRAFDYRSPTCVDDIRAYTGDRLAYVLDCIGNVDTMTLCYGAIGDQGGRYSALEYYPRTLTIRRRDVDHDWILGWTLFGAEVQLAGVYHRPPIPEDRLFGKQWVELIGQLVMQGRLQPHPLDIIPGPLSTVIPQVDRLRQGKGTTWPAVYILYFYPLARFPGPKLWLITRIPNARALASGRLMHRIRQFQEQYGPVVRWAPNELSFIDGQASKDIYGHHGPGRDFPRNPLYYPRAANGAHTILSADNVTHARIRKLISRGFSENALRDQVFGEPFDCLAREEAHQWVKVTFGFFKRLLTIAALTMVVPWARPLLPRRVREQSQQRFAFSCAKTGKRLALGEAPHRSDLITYICRYNDDKGMTGAEIDATADILISAGSETSATALTETLQYLLRNPEKMGKLQREIRGSLR